MVMMLSEELIELANKTIPWTKVQFPSEYDTDIYSHIIDEDRRKNAELLTKVLINPEMAAVLTSLAKSMQK